MNKKTSGGADWRDRDPQFKDEKGSYAEPVPSRQLVLDDLAEAGRPMTWAELTELYALTDKAAEAFEHRLRAMLRDGQLLETGAARWVRSTRWTWCADAFRAIATALAF